MAKKNNQPEEVIETTVGTVETEKVEEKETEKQNVETEKVEEVVEDLIHIDDFLSFYSDLHPVSKTSMRVSVTDRTFRTLKEWQEMEKEYL
jgi:hypothetical protein